MAEQLIITGTSKEDKYKELLPQLEALVSSESDLIANLANISAALHESMKFFWVGFYLVKGDELVLGPFQGPIVCTRIRMGKGVCGTVWQEKKVLIVPDVNEFPGYIACSTGSKSEIVLPAFKNNEVVMVLDVDSDQLNDFDKVDEQYLGQLMQIIERSL